MATDCETNVLCQITGIKTDIDRLYDRTDDINAILGECCLGDDDSEPPPVEPPVVNIPPIALRTISTEAELNTAKAAGGRWYVIKMVPITRTHGFSKPIEFIGFSMDGTDVGFSLNYSPGAVSEEPGAGPRDMFRANIHDVCFRELVFTGNHPLTSGAADQGAVLAIHGVLSGTDMGGIMMDRCEIKNVAIGIYRSGDDPSVAPLKRFRVTNCYIHDFYSGLQLNGHIDDCTIDNNVIKGKDVSTSHTTLHSGVYGDHLGNAIYVANGAEKLIISRNRCEKVDRHAIEVFNYRTNLNQQTQVINNVCNDCAFGISCTGNESTLIHGNTILRPKQIGIEVVGFKQNASAAEIIISNNWIKDVTPIPIGPLQPIATQTQGIAVTCVNNQTLICDNQIIKVTSPIVSMGPETHLDAMGIQLYGVIGLDQAYGVKNVTIRGNRFTDAGNKMIWVNGHSDGLINTEDRFDGISIEGNTFIFSNAYTSLFDGKVGTDNIYSSVFLSAPLGAISVRNNVSFYNQDKPTYGTYKFLGVGTVFSGGGADAPVAQVDPDDDSNIVGSNVRIPHLLS